MECILILLIRKPHIIFLVEIFEAKQGSNWNSFSLSSYNIYIYIIYTNDSAVNVMILTMHFLIAVYIHLKCLQETLCSFMLFLILLLLATMTIYSKHVLHVLSNDVYIVANRPGMAGTVPDFGALSRRCPGRGKIPTMSRNLRSPSASTRLDGHCSPTVSSLVLFDTHNAVLRQFLAENLRLN